ncbi:YdcF family protein [Nonomuraea mesophila]|uniref:YdcF family protein n=1 Tax=Nonomuraea mesophila TaxID=2530382 RepID=A0A4V2Z7T5_9ACTN|nr:YdcF family protein [Nonomuraea mesophila]TDE37736.1 YdcF family protein [Nonomuraea mesophila]
MLRTGLAVAGVVALVWGEWLNRRWSRALTGNREGVREVVVVLGYRNPQARANLVNRWRVRAGLRSVAAGRERDTRVIFSGGPTGTGATEAQLMAGYATSVLGFGGTVLLETESRTTWENVTNVIPLLEDADRIKIVSQPAHALKARAYLRRLRPDLADRLVPADDYRFGEWLLVKPLLAAYGLRMLRGLEDDELRGPSLVRGTARTRVPGSRRGRAAGSPRAPFRAGRPA